MNESTVKMVRESGFKVKFLAGKIGVHPNQLSMALRGERIIPDEKERMLKDFLKMIPA